MKLLLFAIVLFHFANLGETQFTNPLPDYCDCYVDLIQRIASFLNISPNTNPPKMAKKIFKEWEVTAGESDGCFTINEFTRYGFLKEITLQKHY